MKGQATEWKRLLFSAALFFACQASATGATGAKVVLPEEIVVGRNLQAGVMIHLEAPPQADAAGSVGARGISEAEVPSDAPPTRLSVRSHSALLKLAVRPADLGASQITILAPAQNRSAVFFVQAFSDSGTASYTVEAPGYESATGVVRFAPSGVVILGPANISIESGGVKLHIRTVALDTQSQLDPLCAQPLVGDKPLSVLIRNGNPSVGTLPPTGVIKPGSDSGTLEFVPAAPGVTTVSVDQPPGWATPNDMTRLDITVRRGDGDS